MLYKGIPCSHIQEMFLTNKIIILTVYFCMSGLSSDVAYNTAGVRLIASELRFKRVLACAMGTSKYKHMSIGSIFQVLLICFNHGLTIVQQMQKGYFLQHVTFPRIPVGWSD